MTATAQADGQKQAWAACISTMALAVLGVRFVQGFIFWGGASRRMFYDYQEIAGVDHAVKLDFEARVSSPTRWSMPCPASCGSAARSSG